jgi:uncharacterized protein (TIGR03086 family)
VSQNLRNYTKALFGFDAVVQRVPTDRWAAQSPCEGWSAHDVVMHQIGVIDAVAQMARTGAVAWPETPIELDGPVGLWNDCRDGFLEAVDHRDTVKRVGVYWFGESSFDEILAFAQWDPLVHSWDVAQAVGIEPCCSQQVAAASLVTISSMAETLRGMGLMGAPVEVKSDADSMTTLLGLTGRDPYR